MAAETDAAETRNGEEEERKPWTREENGPIATREDLAVYFDAWDNREDTTYFSEVPGICKDEPCQLGIDEAGRGPVLGPMVYGISYAPLSEKQLLVDLGCADSKSLTEEKRDEIFDDICKHQDKIGWAIDVISPNTISVSMQRRSKISLNEISMLSAIGLARKAIDSGARITEIYVDTVGKPEKYQARLQPLFPGVKIVVAKKADATFPIVSAASICAKVSRDHALRGWKFREGPVDKNFGSGYPADPVTKKWLTENIHPVFGFPMLVRFSWSTAESILESKAATVEWEDVEVEEDPSVSKISRYFARSPPKMIEVHKKKHPFFTARCLSNATNL